MAGSLQPLAEYQEVSYAKDVAKLGKYVVMGAVQSLVLLHPFFLDPPSPGVVVQNRQKRWFRLLQL